MSELSAGRELDALVAERVMGWAVVGAHDNTAHMFGYVWNGEPQFSAASAPRSRWTFRPSEDIADAWEVAEKFTTFAIFYDDATCTWFAAVDPKRRTPDDCRFKGAAETAPLAICRAALKCRAIPHESEPHGSEGDTVNERNSCIRVRGCPGGGVSALAWPGR